MLNLPLLTDFEGNFLLVRLSWASRMDIRLGPLLSKPNPHGVSPFGQRQAQSKTVQPNNEPKVSQYDLNSFWPLTIAPSSHFLEEVGDVKVDDIDSQFI